MPWVFRGLRDGVVTTRWPKHADEYFDQFPAAVRVVGDPGATVPDEVAQAAAACPTDAISVQPRPRLDRGRCIVCGRCVNLAPTWFAWEKGCATAELARSALVVGEVDESDEALDELRASLARRVRRLRRSVHIRHVDAGSNGSDEWEIQALTNPVYDVHRLGIFFTASPRHADILLVTGIGVSGMVEPLRRTLDAMPAPTVVIAVGTDAISGGVLGGGYIGGTGVSDLVPVDVWVPGAPASPFSVLHGILLALGRVPLRQKRSAQ
ncbi:ferredoxin [Mycobacterium xenopi]|uniref:4Fe-4S ferredoxin-type domain-containing protein n=1 Tax=Mycobacterium xenopi TaxID=1789 RepID=A0AAD1H2G9_MYCXE|nr:ferredoxin [Mycobacterium xenopi]EUA34162.1 4Fe-4S single cluster domain protein [Mycobacterium xenopi 3993]MDA3639318.1 ferredoxin [Mycobacterium xenopi]MDA3658376.1 ferredoxin [Mycobacterium xenopi]MDA3662132.1 ferredoxin [Mycobacterium xenopi]ORX20637.1 NADH:ubiquinone oxidoreductase [Mycobacterium xenopi]